MNSNTKPRKISNISMFVEVVSCNLIVVVNSYHSYIIAQYKIFVFLGKLHPFLSLEDVLDGLLNIYAAPKKC